MMTNQDLINHINETSYNQSLKIVNIVKSVNCKEWENEKKDAEYKNYPMATRYYFEIKNDNCNKLSKHQHIGHIDFRSSSVSISDAYLPKPDDPSFFVTCEKSYISDDPFHPTIVTVPYTTTNPNISLCSPASLWILLRSLSNEFGKEYVSLTDINNNLPSNSKGKPIAIKEYINLFQKYNYSAHYYLGKKKKDFYDACEDQISKCNECLLEHFYSVFRDSENDFKESLMTSDILYSYIESEIPVYLVFESKALAEELDYKGETTDMYHSVVAIGHTLDDKYDISHFIIHDVSYAPFKTISKKFVDNNLFEALVLLPKDVNRRYEHFITESFSSNSLSNKKSLKKILKAYNSRFDQIFMGSLKIRPFLMRSQRIKFWFTNKDLYPQKEINNMYSNADFPKYVWVFEIKTSNIKENNQCVGHIIFDATTSEDTKGLVLINFPKHRLWFQNRELHEEFPSVSAFDSIAIFKSPYLA